MSFCVREPYNGTAPEQKKKSAKIGLNSMFKPIFFKSIVIIESCGRSKPLPYETPIRIL